MAHALEKSIQEKEVRIKSLLEGTGLISDIEFHAHNYFYLRFLVYNNPRAREVISDCCNCTSRKLREQVKYINIRHDNYNGDFACRITIDPTKKGASPQIIDNVLTYLEQDLNNYIRFHEAEIRAYRKLKQKRTKCA